MRRSRVLIGSLSILSAMLAFSTVWAVPPAPVGFVATDATDCGVINLSWAPLVAADGAKIYRDGVLIAIAGPTVTSHLDYEMAGAGAFVYCIEAFDVMGPSPMVCDGATLPASPITIDPWDWYNDAFPSSNVTPPGTAAFDKTTAVLVTGHNLAPCTGVVSRPVMPDDKVTITVAGPVVRVDLVLRIEPGPGNYCATGVVGSGLMPDPAVPCPPACAPGDGTFWGDLMAAPGLFATPTAVALHAAAPSGWDKHVWNSRECEALGGGVFQTTDAAAPGVKILPDGLFCPGTHVEYFFRVVLGGDVINVPETLCVIQKKVEGSIDGHRWAEFSVLPDRWKDGAWPPANRHAAQPACVLVVDLDDMRGNERAWTSVADSTLMTQASRYGANNGWHAYAYLAGSKNPVNVDDPANNVRPDNTTGFIAAHGGSAGTTWDLYNVRGAQYHCPGNAGALGGRAGVVPAGFTAPGPTGAMLRTYYRTIILLSGDRSSTILGPLVDRSQDDLAMLDDFLKTAGGTPKPRNLIVEGSGFAASEVTSHAAFLAATFSAGLVSDDYRTYSGNASTAVDLTTTGSLNIYGIVNAAPVANDVLSFFPPGQMRSKYPDTGVGPNPKVASIYSPDGGGPLGQYAAERLEHRRSRESQPNVNRGTNRISPRRPQADPRVGMPRHGCGGRR